MWRDLPPLRVKIREYLIGQVYSRLIAALQALEAPFFAMDADAPIAREAAGFLFLLHVHGGGANKQALAEAARFELEGKTVSFLTFHPMKRRFILSIGGRRKQYAMPWQGRALTKRIADLRPEEIRLHHARYWPDYVVLELPGLARRLGARFSVVLHDFIYLCPRINLLDGHYRFCGAPTDTAVCGACTARGGALTTHVKDVGAWRRAQAALLRAANSVDAPSHDTAAIYQKLIPGLAIEVRPHESVVRSEKPASQRKNPQLTIAVVGNLLRYKGADIVLRAASVIAENNLPITLSIVGNSVYREEFARLGVPCTGPYRPADLVAHLHGLAPDYVWLASPWPETYCFVLSEAWELGYPVIAFDLGAPAERIRTRNSGDALLPPALADDIPALCSALLALR